MVSHRLTFRIDRMSNGEAWRRISITISPDSGNVARPSSVFSNDIVCDAELFSIERWLGDGSKVVSPSLDNGGEHFVAIIHTCGLRVGVEEDPTQLQYSS